MQDNAKASVDSKIIIKFIIDSMKPRAILCLALVLSGGLSGCATDARHSSTTTATVTLKFVKVDSEETEGQDGYGRNAVDGNPNTYWHTQWHGNSPGLPHEIIIELVPPAVIRGFTYLPRQDESDHGTIKDYEFYVSNDGKNFGRAVNKGTFKSGKEEKIETFAPIECRFIKLKAISEIHGLPWTSAAEIGVIQSCENADFLTNPINQANALLAEFKKTRSIEQLDRAFRALESMPFPGVDHTVPWSAARGEQAKMWLNLLATIDQNIDTNFGVNDPQYWAAVSLTPPGTAEGLRYPSGVDPKDIKEPQIRLQYEAAIKQNEEKKARCLFQTRLRNISALAGLDAERFFRAYYTSSKKDQNELGNLMQQAKLSPNRTEKIKGLFQK